MARLLRKQDALFVLYDRVYDDDFFFIIKITSKKGGDNFYKQWMEFHKELDELMFSQCDEDWICEDEDFKDRIALKKELEKRGFNVKLANLLDEN